MLERQAGVVQGLVDDLAREAPSEVRFQRRGAAVPVGGVARLPFPNHVEARNKFRRVPVPSKRRGTGIWQVVVFEIRGVKVRSQI